MTMEHAVPTRFKQTCLRFGWDDRGGCEGGEDGVVDCEEDEDEGGEKPWGVGGRAVGRLSKEGAGDLDAEAGEDGEEEGGD